MPTPSFPPSNPEDVRRAFDISFDIFEWISSTSPDWFKLIDAGAGIGTTLLVLFAVLTLRQQSHQSKASFMMELENKWDNMEKSRQEVFDLYEELRVSLPSREVETSEHLERRKEKGKQLVDGIKSENKKRYQELIVYLNFFETVGLLVRRDHVQMKDIVGLYKGAILAIDELFAKHIEEWESESDVPDGLYEHVLWLVHKTREREDRREKSH